jgi:exodeoxyribonuclease VII small subunit
MDNISELSFEAAYTALDAIIEQLESGSLPLDQSVTLFEQGRKLADHCQSLLDKAELRVRQLDDEGTLS